MINIVRQNPLNVLYLIIFLIKITSTFRFNVFVSTILKPTYNIMSCIKVLVIAVTDVLVYRVLLIMKCTKF
jgi:hypothetical protein